MIRINYFLFINSAASVVTGVAEVSVDFGAFGAAFSVVEIDLLGSILLLSFQIASKLMLDININN
jgi:hypothetical protein